MGLKRTSSHLNTSQEENPETLFLQQSVCMFHVINPICSDMMLGMVVWLELSLELKKLFWQAAPSWGEWARVQLVGEGEAGVEKSVIPRK